VTPSDRDGSRRPTVQLRDIVTDADRSCGQGDGSPQAFYEHYGFVATGEIKWDDTVLRLDLQPADEEAR
jgi:hypothetical protein